MQTDTLNTTAQIVLTCLGFVAFCIEFFSDHFSKGKALHKDLRAAKLLTALLVAGVWRSLRLSDCERIAGVPQQCIIGASWHIGIQKGDR